MSILFTTEELKKIEPHPQEYVDMKTKYLEQISQLNYSKINQLPFITVAKAQHRQLLDKVKCYQFEEKKQLSTHQFNTLFQESKPIKSQPEQLREEYFKQFILAPQQEEVSKKEIEKNRYLHVCGVINSEQVDKKEYKKHVQELRELQLEISKMQSQNKKVYVPPKEMCRNPQLINKVATSMLNMYNVYFKEIFDCLIDEILLDEIQYLNEQTQTPQKEQSEPDEEAQIDDVKDLLKHLGNMLEDY